MTIDLSPLVEKLNTLEDSYLRLLELMENKQVNSEPKIVNMDGLMEYRPEIGSRSNVYKQISNGLPHSKRGGRLFFKLDLIDEYLYPTNKTNK